MPCRAPRVPGEASVTSPLEDGTHGVRRSVDDLGGEIDGLRVPVNADLQRNQRPGVVALELRGAGKAPLAAIDFASDTLQSAGKARPDPARRNGRTGRAGRNDRCVLDEGALAQDARNCHFPPFGQAARRVACQGEMLRRRLARRVKARVWRRLAQDLLSPSASAT